MSYKEKTDDNNDTPLPPEQVRRTGLTLRKLGQSETLDYSLLSPLGVLRPASRVRPPGKDGVHLPSLVSVSQVRKRALMVPPGNNERISPAL